MPVADYNTYCRMIDHALEKKFAYPAINVTSLTTANGVLKGLAESNSDGIIQVSTGGAAFASGLFVKDMPLGAISIAEHVHRAAERYPIYVALHTDHCLAKMLDQYVHPLIEETEKRRAAGKPNLFNSHMFDGSDLPLEENLDIAVKLLGRRHKNDIIPVADADRGNISSSFCR
ncbi:MAG: class II fructose-bisphosphate aldolase [Desulfobacterales bacterium]